MRYALAVLTHGDNEDVLANTIRSFDAHVQPPPVHRVVVQDGPCALPPFAPYPWTCLTIKQQSGYCAATAALWAMASALEGIDYVFWLEHDFDFKRTVSLYDMAELLDLNPDLAQVSLMRGPVNGHEQHQGGVVKMHEGRGSSFEASVTYGARGNPIQWLRHRAYFTTNPSLMTRQFMLDNPWPDYRRECEGRMAIDLKHRGFDFGVIGDGSPWVEHTGKRTGRGY